MNKQLKILWIVILALIIAIVSVLVLYKNSYVYNSKTTNQQGTTFSSDDTKSKSSGDTKSESSKQREEHLSPEEGKVLPNGDIVLPEIIEDVETY